MSCKFCERESKVRGMCETHYHRWLALKRPEIWDGGAPLPPLKSRLKTVAPNGEIVEDYVEFLLGFREHCVANRLNFRGEIMEAIGMKHPKFKVRT